MSAVVVHSIALPMASISAARTARTDESSLIQYSFYEDHRKERIRCRRLRATFFDPTVLYRQPCLHQHRCRRDLRYKTYVVPSSGVEVGPVSGHLLQCTIGVYVTATSIWFEIWGVVDPSKKIQFSRQISEKFRFFQAFTKNLRFFQEI